MKNFDCSQFLTEIENVINVSIVGSSIFDDIYNLASLLSYYNAFSDIIMPDVLKSDIVPCVKRIVY